MSWQSGSINPATTSPLADISRIKNDLSVLKGVLGGAQDADVPFTPYAWPAARIVGDFSNATIANRVMFQTSTVGAITSVAALPNGGGFGAAYTVFSTSDPANAVVGVLEAVAGGAEVRFHSTRTGSASLAPMTFYTGGAERMRIDTLGQVLAGQNQTAQFPGPSLTVTDSGHATSRRASIGIGSAWTLLQDSGGTGTKDFALYNTASGRLRMQFDVTGNSTHTDPNGGLGYGVGAGGTVTQSTSKSTTVTLNKPCGQITMNNAALAAGASVSFQVNNTLVLSTDTVVVTAYNNANYRVEPMYVVGGGNFGIRVTNVTGGSLAEALQINFAIVRGSTS